EPFVRIERGKIVEIDLVADPLGVLEIDGVDLQKREIALAFFGRADLAFYRIAGPQPEAADLGGADIDVVRPGQVVGVRGAQEAEPVGQDLDNALAGDFHLAGRQLLEYGEHQLLLAQGIGVFDVELFGKGLQLGRGLGLEVPELHEFHDQPSWGSWGYVEKDGADGAK